MTTEITQSQGSNSLGLSDGRCDETNQSDASPDDAREVVVLEELALPMEVYQYHHSDPHSVHHSVDPESSLVVTEGASSYADPNQ